MGNYGSRRKERRLECRYSRSEDELSDDKDIPTEYFGGITPDSYDKLLAWMVEMAENDEADLRSPAFVEHFTTVCAEKGKQSTTELSPAIRSIPPIRQNSFEVPVRQHSLDSSNSSQISRSSKSREDKLHPKTRLRRAMLSRQSTFDYSDDSYAPHDGISYCSFESDADLSPHTRLINSIGKTSFTNHLRPPLRKNQSCTTYQNYNTSIADLLNADSRKKSKSLMTMRNMLSETRNDEEITPIIEETVVKVLDNDMLDRNMADILYSVEALRPKAPNGFIREQKG